MVVTSWANIHSMEFNEPALGTTVATLGGKIVFAVEVDNTANAATAVFLKFLEGPGTSGTTGADEMYKIPASTKMKIVLNGVDGLLFTNVGISCVTGAIWSDNTAPASSVPVKVWTN